MYSRKSNHRNKMYSQLRASIHQLHPGSVRSFDNCSSSLRLCSILLSVPVFLVCFQSKFCILNSLCMLLPNLVQMAKVPFGGADEFYVIVCCSVWLNSMRVCVRPANANDEILFYVFPMLTFSFEFDWISFASNVELLFSIWFDEAKCFQIIF